MMLFYDQKCETCGNCYANGIESLETVLCTSVIDIIRGEVQWGSDTDYLNGEHHTTGYCCSFCGAELPEEIEQYLDTALDNQRYEMTLIRKGRS